MKIIKTAWENFGVGSIRLGRQGENLVRRLKVDISAPLEAHPDADFAIRVESPAGVVYNAAQTVQEDEWLLWDITDADTAVSGEGSVQIVMIGDGEEIAKTAKAKTVVLSSLGSGGEAPDPVKGWLDEAQKLLEDLKDQGSVSEEEVRQIIADWMASHPITETDPTVPSWAKQPQKPTYTAQEVGAVSTEELETAKEEIVQDVLDAMPEPETGLPDGAQPNQYLVTDENGDPAWEEKLFYTEMVPTDTILETVLHPYPGQDYAEPVPVLPEDGKEYLVTVNGEKTRVVAVDPSYYEVYLGNRHLQGDQNEDTGENFLLEFSYQRENEPYTVRLWTAFEATDVAVGVYKEGVEHRVNIPKSEPNKYVTTDGDGNAAWTDVLYYKNEVTVFDGTVSIPEPDTQTGSLGVLPFYADQMCIVEWNGVRYERESASVNYDVDVLVGNLGAFGVPGYDDTGEPFVLSFSEYGAYVTSLDGSTNPTVKITWVIEQKIGSDKLALSPGEAYKQLVSDAKGAAVWEPKTFYNEMVRDEILPITSMRWTYTQPLKMQPVVGETYLVIANSGEYRLVAFEKQGMICLGNANIVDSNDTNTGEPFVVYFPSDGMNLAYTAGVRINYTAPSISIGVFKETEVARVNIPKTKPNQYLVTDGDGNAKWEDRLCYEEEGAVLLDDTITFGDGVQGIVETVLDIVGGNTYNVYWNGTVYQCKATLMSADGQTGVLLGDFSSMTGSEPTGEPFVVVAVESVGTMIVALDGSASATVKIAKVDLRKLPEKFYDADPPYIDLVAYGFGEPVEETQIKTFSEIGLSEQEVLELRKKAEKLNAVFAVATASTQLFRKCFGTAQMQTIEGINMIYYSIIAVNGGTIESLEVSFVFEPDGSGEILVRNLGRINTIND